MTAAVYKEFRMIDIQGPEWVQVEVNTDGTLWVIVDGVCHLRIHSASTLVVEDNRKQ